MTEEELLKRLKEIRQEAYDAGRWKITKMVDKLMQDRWGNNGKE